MGLDMYLFRKKHGEPFEKGTEVMYWRKANAIRGFFVNNIKDFHRDDSCKEVVVKKKVLAKLIATCNAVLNDKRKADKLLPTRSGFFFGGTVYNEYYFDELKKTAGACRKIINETDWKKEEIVYYDWW